jgi:hypothetical protein
MDPVEIGFFALPVFLGVLVLRLGRGNDWPWVTCLLLALVPLAATFFFAVYGLLLAALFVGGLYKASALRR